MWWSDTVGLRTRLVSNQKKIGLGLGLPGLVLCCETRSCYARRHNDLEGHNNFSSTIYSFSILCLEHHYCGNQQWRSLITWKLNPLVPLFTSGGFCLGMVLRIWSCLRRWYSYSSRGFCHCCSDCDDGQRTDVEHCGRRRWRGTAQRHQTGESLRRQHFRHRCKTHRPRRTFPRSHRPTAARRRDLFFFIFIRSFPEIISYFYFLNWSLIFFLR